MALQSAFANLFEAITARLDSVVTEIRYINHDFGQLEEPRPSVSWPCALFDFDEFELSETGNKPKQLADGFVQVRLGLQQWSKTSNIATEQVREKGLQYYEVEQKVYAALHNWAPAGFSRLLCRKRFTEKRDDDVRVRVLVFAISYEESAAVQTFQLVPRPDAVINSEVGSPD